MKNILITITLLLITPIIDSCGLYCNCEANDLRYDYSSLIIYPLNEFPVPLNEQFKAEISADVELISMNKESTTVGSALMACSCVTYYYPLHMISEVEVITTPSYFNTQDSSSVINPIVEILYYDENYTEHIVNLGKNPSPQFSIANGPFLTARILERPFAADSAYSITFNITRSNGDIVSSTISDVTWVK